VRTEPGPRSEFGAALAETAADFRRGRLGATLGAGLVMGLVQVVLAITFAAVIFRGELRADLSVGIGIALFGSATIGIIAALTSSLPGMASGTQDSTSAVLGVAAASIAGSTTAAATLPTVEATIIVASLATGLSLYALGRFEMGELIRYIPLPVIGGFLAGTGVLLVEGSWDILTGGAGTAHLLDGDVAAVWVPGVAMALSLVLASRRDSMRLALPVVLVALPVALHSILWASGVGREGATARGWLLSGLPDARVWEPHLTSTLADADWSVVAAQAGSILTVVGLSAASFLLYVGGLELALDRDIDPDRDLRGLGVANAVSGLGGGAPGYAYVSITTLGAKLAEPRRGAAVISGLACLGVIVAGASVLRWVPVALIGGLLMFIGFTFIIEWLWDARRRLPRADFVLVLLIAAAITFLGFLPGVVIGVVVAVVLFVVRYSQIDVIRHAMSGEHYRSNIDRPESELAVLSDAGSSISILELQGFLFFGTANRILELVTRRLDDASTPALRFLVCDFAGVSGLDSSTAMSFAKVLRAAGGRGFRVVVSSASEETLGILIAERPKGVAGPVAHADLDHAIQWCEEQILTDAGSVESTADMSELFARVIDDPVAVERVVSAFEHRTVEAGQVLVTHGQSAPGLFFIEDGRVEARVEGHDGGPIRLRTIRAGRSVGEMSMYLGTPASATVVTETACSVRYLSADAFRRLSADDPAVAGVLHLVMARTLAERVVYANEAVRSLSRRTGS
jgi:SulP family sulfate permease